MLSNINNMGNTKKATMVSKAKINVNKTPSPKKPKLFKSPKKGPSNESIFGKPIVRTDVIHTWAVGYNSEFLVATVEKSNGVAGYMYPVRKLLEVRTSDNDVGKALITSDVFDCRNTNNLFMRKGRAVNQKIQITNGKPYCQIGIVSSPNKNMSTSMKGCDKAGTNTEYYEKYFRDEIESVLLHAEKVKMEEKKVREHNIVTRFEPWNHLKHSRTNREGITFFDHVFYDESVGDILRVYYLPTTLEDAGVYNFLKKPGWNCFFSRYDGRYSDYAINVFGFPNNVAELDVGDVSECENDDEFEYVA